MRMIDNKSLRCCYGAVSDKKRSVKKRIATGVCLFSCMCVIALTSSCTNTYTQNDKISKDIYAMDTYMSLSVYEDEMSNDILKKAEDEIRKIEGLVSAHKEGSELEQLNGDGTALFSEYTLKILEKSIEIYEMTDGAFNPAVYPVMELWGFSTKEYRVPEKEELNNKLANMDVMKISIEHAKNNPNSEEVAEVTVPSGMKLDFGGIAKGYTSDKIISLFRENGVESAIVNLGGNVHALGSKPDGSMWKTAIRHPEKDGYIGVINVNNKAVVTSGGYERFFEEGGKTYHHIIDPETGYPADKGVVSVSIVSEDGMLADGLSTALFVMGYEKSVSLWKQYSDKFDFIMMTDDGDIYVTEGIKNDFSSDYDCNFVYMK